MKTFVIAFVVLLLGALAMGGRTSGPSGGYIPITAVDPVVVQATTGGYSLDFPFDLIADWNGSFEFQLVNWTLKYKPVSVKASEYIALPNGVFAEPAWGERRAHYTNVVALGPGTYDFELSVSELQFSFPNGNSTAHWRVTIP